MIPRFALASVKIHPNLLRCPPNLSVIYGTAAMMVFLMGQPRPLFVYFISSQQQFYRCCVARELRLKKVTLTRKRGKRAPGHFFDGTYFRPDIFSTSNKMGHIFDYTQIVM